jgi:hypothetical protein
MGFPKLNHKLCSETKPNPVLWVKLQKGRSNFGNQYFRPIKCVQTKRSAIDFQFHQISKINFRAAIEITFGKEIYITGHSLSKIMITNPHKKHLFSLDDRML